MEVSNIDINFYYQQTNKSMNESQQQSKQKFIGLMRNLTQYINQNPAHQLTIYSCLNTQQIKRLFQSLHDHSKILRLTALYFIAKLLFNSPQIVDTLLTRDNCDLTTKRNNSLGATVPSQKFLVTGLSNYQLQPQILAEIVLLINTKVKYKRNTLFWYVNIESKTIGYFSVEDSLESMDIDPKDNIAGLFVGQTDSGIESTKSFFSTASGVIKKNLPVEQGKTKYTISKTGQASTNRKN